jgi:hypothetical protein
VVRQNQVVIEGAAVDFSRQRFHDRFFQYAQNTPPSVHLGLAFPARTNLDGDVESQIQLQSARCGSSAQPTGMLQPLFL